MANHRGGSGNFAEDRERASEAGKKGGQHSGGNFKNDPQRASEARQKVITAGYPGGFLFMAPDEQLLAVERQPTFCLTTH